MGGNGSSSRKNKGGAASSSNSPVVSMKTAESMLKDTPGWGKHSEVKNVFVSTNKDGTVNLTYTFNTTPGPGNWTSENKKVTIKKVKP